MVIPNSDISIYKKNCTIKLVKLTCDCLQCSLSEFSRTNFDFLFILYG